MVACVGGGSNAIGIFVPFVDDPGVALVGVEAAGEGVETGRHGAPLTAGGRGGVLHGSYSAIMQDEDGQILEAHSISAGLDYPGTGPEHAHLRDTGRARYVAVTDAEALAAFRRVAQLEGIVPALESSHAVAWVLGPGAGEPSEHVDLVCLSGRGDKDLAEVLAAHAMIAAETGVERIAAAFAAAAGRAALMPYLMGGFPTLEASVAVGEACADAGADLIELGVPFSDPLADGPVIHAAGTQALAAGATVHGVLEVGARLAERVPVVLMCYANPLLARGAERFADELASRHISGLIVPDLPLEEAPGMLAACDAAGVALVPLVAPTTPEDRLAAIGARARGFVYTVAVTGTTGERDRDRRRAGRQPRARARARHRPGRRRLRHLDARSRPPPRRTPAPTA